MLSGKSNGSENHDEDLRLFCEFDKLFGDKEEGSTGIEMTL